jgi:hypothetical protein
MLRSATIHDDSWRELEKTVIITSPDEESRGGVPNFYLSDASGIGAMRQMQRAPPNRHAVVKAPETLPRGRGFTAANTSHSADNLLSHLPGGSSSDEGSGGETVGECFICYNTLDEDSPEMTPRNLRCGHAFCTGELGLGLACLG